MPSIRTLARRAFAIATFAAAGASASAAPSLVGDTILRVSQPQLTGEIIDPQFAIVSDPGVEYIDSFDFAGEFRRINVGPTSIRMENTQTWFSPWWDTGNPPSYFEFRDLDFSEPGWSIVGVNVTWGGTIFPEDDSPLNYPAFGPGAVAFNADTVRLYIGPYQFEAGSWVQIDLILAPTPSAAVLAGLGLLAAGRRRR
jgi:hypothetical protein